MHYVEVKYMPEKSNAYLGSPSILKLKDGALLATHDHFGAEGILDRHGECGLTSVYRSEDDGATWMNITHIPDCFWGTLCEHNGEIYLFSCSREYGDLLLRKSTDGGFNWSVPKDSRSGVLAVAGPHHDNPNYHAPISSWYKANGRIYKAVELFDTSLPVKGFSPQNFLACIISAPEDADLLDSASWSFSNQLKFPQEAFGDDLVHERSGWLEGTIVTAPDGSLKNLMRIHLRQFNKVAILDISPDGKTLSFDPASGITDFHGGTSKFVVRYDEKSKLYYTLANPRTFFDDMDISQRNILTLSCSADLYNWRELTVVAKDESGLSEEMSCRLTGFQYPDWQFDGDDIIALVRTAYRGARRFHDANRITFHRIKNFRDLI